MEVTSIEGAAQVRAKHTRFENGRLTSETLEGSLPASAYDRLVAETQKVFASQTAFLLEQLSLFLPTSKRSSRSDK